MNKPEIICTIGPASLNDAVLRRFAARGVSLVRINLSHVPQSEVSGYIDFLERYRIPIAIDTEGCQIRTGEIREGVVIFKSNDVVMVHRDPVPIDAHNIYFTPKSAIDAFTPGDLIALDFNSVLLRVEAAAKSGVLRCRVVIEGAVGSRKGVHCDTARGALPPFSEKDLDAIALARTRGIRHFTLSFMNNADDVRVFRGLYPDAVAYAKIETLAGLKCVDDILKLADGILIDRGDLSREVPIERIPLIQKYLIGRARAAGRKALVASNLLETMATELKPSRAEANDIVSTASSGASGFVLTKETAVGRYPIETVNMLNALVVQAGQERLEIDALVDRDRLGLLVAPHGGRLIEREASPSDIVGVPDLPKIYVSDELIMDLEQIAIGAFSPLEGFMGRDDYRSVLRNMRLASGLAWTMPVILPIKDQERKRLKIGERIAIGAASDGAIYGILELNEIYPFDKEEYASSVFGTTDARHPGIRQLKDAGEILLGGKVRLIRRRPNSHSRVDLTPRQTRNVFESLGWSKVVGFHSRNVIHRSHEHIQLAALERCACDGLFVHPVIGKKKSGDYTAETIIESYEIMMERFYPRNRVVFGVFSSYSRYAGPREAVFTALCRKNYGCSHFIVGRDHAGVGSFYGPESSQEIFSRFDGLGIEPVFFGEIGYSQELKRYVSRGEHSDGALSHISGTEARRLFQQQIAPPEWFMHPAISALIVGKIARGEQVFVA